MLSSEPFGRGSIPSFFKLDFNNVDRQIDWEMQISCCTTLVVLLVVEANKALALELSHLSPAVDDNSAKSLRNINQTTTAAGSFEKWESKSTGICANGNLCRWERKSFSFRFHFP